VFNIGKHIVNIFYDLRSKNRQFGLKVTIIDVEASSDFELVLPNIVEQMHKEIHVVVTEDST
jgi:hypothetical protein